MLKKLIGAACVAALFACSDDSGDDNKGDTGTDPSSSSTGVTADACNANNDYAFKLVDMQTKSATNAGAKWAILIVDPKEYKEQLLKNPDAAPYTCPENDPSGCEAGTEVTDMNVLCGRVDGEIAACLKEYDFEADVGGATIVLGIGTDAITDNSKLGTYKTISYKFKGPSHEFRLATNGEEGIFWRSVQDASFDEWKEVSIILRKDGDGEKGGFEAGSDELLDAEFDLSQIQNIQWMPDGVLDPTGSFYVTTLYGCK